MTTPVLSSPPLDVVLEAAKRNLIAEMYDNTSADVVRRQIAAELGLYGIDILRDPSHMAALSVLSDCLKFGLEPSPRALRMLGVEVS